MAGALGAAASSVWLLWANDVPGVLRRATVLGASTTVLLGSNCALANELGTRGREALHMSMVNLGTTGGSAAAKALGPGIDLLNRIYSEGRGYDAMLIACGSLLVLGAILLMPLKIEAPDAIAATQSPEETG